MMMKINNDVFFLYLVMIAYSMVGCAGNNICINLNEKKIVSKEGDIVRFEIEENDTSYYFLLKGNVRHQKTVDLKDIYSKNRVDESFRFGKMNSFSLKPRSTYIFTNRTVFDASRVSLKFYTDSVGNLHS
ncbi:MULTISPECIES: hypothetical protein [Sphingobacterium]|uniref:hypothetical protein n=1 Tax=Sphingobacterium TaxID=28453 RepID=UPI0008A29227|nr:MULTISPECIES: hypothetical protein [Sphingobacterium]OFV13021.1 hypothetical protein HMPREF3127_15260 [Sphingobacterium sp. HMSC13C05]QQT62708.1 hypothetical protein I6I97_02495 [Sphingobacterium multivorum]HAL52293.1 hypothetical protein [Sphingobacterium sp.]